MQVIFFGFGWLFFMRQLFKNYEVSILSDFLASMCEINTYIVYTYIHTYTHMYTNTYKWCPLSEGE